MQTAEMMTNTNEMKAAVGRINDAFTNNDTEAFLAECTDGLVWTMVGENTAEGKDSIRQWMSSMPEHEAPKFTVDKMIAEGDTVVCYGEMAMPNKEGKMMEYGYCDIYVFDGAKVAELRSFVTSTQKAKAA